MTSSGRQIGFLAFTIRLTKQAYAFFAALPRDPRCTLIFPDEYGRQYTQASSLITATLTVERRAIAAGRECRRLRFHDLRHDFAVWALRSP
jgi:integrase